MVNTDWLAGFADGEGCFAMQWKRRAANSDKKYLCPYFTIQLRADDKGAFDFIDGCLGISGYMIFRKPPQNRRWNTKPCWQSWWKNKEQLLAVVQYFSHHKLQSKKLKDFNIWEKAVKIYLSEKDINKRNIILEELNTELKRVRAYSL